MHTRSLLQPLGKPSLPATSIVIHNYKILNCLWTGSHKFYMYIYMYIYTHAYTLTQTHYILYNLQIRVNISLFNIYHFLIIKYSNAFFYLFKMVHYINIIYNNSSMQENIFLLCNCNLLYINETFSIPLLPLF